MLFALPKKTMDNQRYTSADGAGIGEVGRGSSDLEGRLRETEAALDELRETTSTLEREIAVMRADLERLRVESEKAAGTKLP